MEVTSPTSTSRRDSKQPASPVLDRSHTYGPPLDYTFKEIKEWKDLITEDPVSGTKKREDPRSPPKKLNTTSLRLSNNYISNYDGMEAAIAAIMDDPSKLMWLDLSQNKLETIGNVLTSYPELSTLYLHGNAIRSLKEVEKLGKLPNLVKLTLNGNPIEELPNYRLFVFAMVPTLRTLDFIPITKVDRDRADTWLQQHSRRAMYKH